MNHKSTDDSTAPEPKTGSMHYIKSETLVVAGQHHEWKQTQSGSRQACTPCKLGVAPAVATNTRSVSSNAHLQMILRHSSVVD